MLDPACGDGSLLLALGDAAGTPFTKDISVFGLDQDKHALQVARRALDSVSFAHVELIQADFLDSATAHEQKLFDVVTATHIPTDFDLIIANPPYVRTQVLGARRSRQLAQTHRLSGRVDLFHAFVQKMTDHLRDGGILALLCSNKFLSTQAGEAVRAVFQHDYQLHSITDLGDTKLFQAAVLPAIVIANKRSSLSPGQCSFTQIYTAPAKAARHEHVPSVSSPIEALRSGVTGHISISGSLYTIERGVLDTAKRPTHAWSLSHSGLASWLDTVKAHTSCSFENVAKIRVGIKTTSDSVFIRSDWERLPNSMRPESHLLHPLITHHEARRWRATPGTKKVLYPHVDVNGRAAPLSLDDYPLAKAYLESHKTKLSARKYLQEARRNWFEIWVPQRPSDWPKRKIVFPDIAESPRFLLDASGAIVNGDCYWMALGDDVEEELAYLLLAVGNSTFAMRYYDAVCGNRLYAGRRRFITQYVKTFPLPDRQHPAVARIVGLVRELVHGQDDKGQDVENKLNALVWASFGLTEEVSWQRDL